jgi:hypothetical protein
MFVISSHISNTFDISSLVFIQYILFIISLYFIKINDVLSLDHSHFLTIDPTCRDQYESVS